jgi:glycosyltransferase EpsF
MGGAETWLMELLKHWSLNRRVQMDLLLTSGERGIFDQEAIKLGARLYYVPYVRSNLLRFVKEFRRILRDGQYDAIHDHSDYAAGWRLLMGFGVTPPVRVTHVHNPWLHIDANYAVTPSRRLSTIIGKKLVNLLATQISGTSTAVLRRYGFEPGREQKPPVEVIHCGIDVSAFNRSRELDRASVLREFDWPGNSKLVLFAGRLDRALQIGHPQNHKNSWFALHVAREASKCDSRLRLMMAGSGDRERNELERHISEWRLQDRLKLIGIRRDIPRLMRAADALLFPSRQEGLGMVAVEAQAAGLPVLASDAVPSECVVIPSLYQALPLDRPIEEWAAALLQAMEKSRFSAKQRGRFFQGSAFSIEESAKRLERIYSSGDA